MEWFAERILPQSDYADYEAKCAPLVADYRAKCDALVIDAIWRRYEMQARPK